MIDVYVNVNQNTVMDQPELIPKDESYAARVRDSFALQGAMATIGASLADIAPGRVATALDSACGYAGFTLMPSGTGILTIEYKINLLAPATGQHFRMLGQVIKLGRTVTVTEGRAFAVNEGREKLIATMGATLMAITGREDVKH